MGLLYAFMLSLEDEGEGEMIELCDLREGGGGGGGVVTIKNRGGIPENI